MLYHWSFALSFFITVLLADFATAAIHWDEMLVKHSWNAIPANWESLGNTTSGAIIKLHIVLKPNRESALIDTLYEVSNPEHPRYGAYLFRKQVADLVSPPADTLDLVRAWLVHHGIRPSAISTTHGGSWLTVTDVLVSRANQLLGASYQVYQNSKTGHTTIRTVSYALPAVLHTRIETVAPTTYFPSTRELRPTPRMSSSRAAPEQAQAASRKVITTRQIQQVPGITPSVLRWLYGTGSYIPKVPYQNTLGILGIENDYASPQDLVLFMRRHRSEADDATFTVEQWNGSRYRQRMAGDVANIGIQYGAAITYPTKLVFYSMGGEPEWTDPGGKLIAGDVYLEWFNNLLRQESLRQTISIPYGHTEQDLPREYAGSVCRLFAQLGERGVTVLVASGLYGVGNGDCVNAEGIVQFVPEFPSTCPYVTSVGGTTKFPAMGANLSGGGFSFYHQRPGFQQQAVTKYLQKFPDVDGRYNRGGRGYPDISAQAKDYQIFTNDHMVFVDGTACSVSTAAGIVSLLNDFRISRKRRPLGFFNPWLYRNLRGINDVVFGSNPGCNTAGFSATTGWDLVGPAAICLSETFSALADIGLYARSRV